MLSVSADAELIEDYVRRPVGAAPVAAPPSSVTTSTHEALGSAVNVAGCCGA